MATSRILSKLKGYTAPRKFVRDTSYFLFLLATWAPAVIFFNDHVAEIAFIHGPSMYPYLNKNAHDDIEKKDICFVNKWNPTQNLQRGMLVEFWSPYHPEIFSIKRIIALEGDTVYTRAPYPYPTAVVPLNHVWVEGDNRDGNQSLDSNHYGPIAMPLILGKVTHVLWPKASFGVVPWWEFRGRTKIVKGRREEAPRFD